MFRYFLNMILFKYDFKSEIDSKKNSFGNGCVNYS